MPVNPVQKYLPILSILVVVIASAAIRYSYNTQTLFVQPQIRADAARYVQYATNLVDHATFSKGRESPPVPDAYWAPGYPAYIAGFIGLSRASDGDAYGYKLTLLSQVVLGVATIVLTYLLAGLFMSGYWPLFPAALVAFSPHLVSMGSYMLTETLFGFLILLAVFLLAKGLSREKGKFFWGLSGPAFSAAYLVNPVVAILPPVLVLTLWLSGYFSTVNEQARRTSTTNLLALLLVPMLMVAAMWSVRGYVSVPGGAASSSDRLLANLSVGLHPDYHEKWRQSILEPEKNVVVPGTVARSSYPAFFQALKNEVSDDPVGVLRWYAVGKPLQLWDWNILTGQGDIYVYDVIYSLYHVSKPALVSYSVMRVLHPWLLLFCALGLVLLVRDRGRDQVLPLTIYATLVSLSLVYAVTQAAPRYSIPLRPELYLGATFFLWKLSQYFQAYKRKSAAH